MSLFLTDPCFSHQTTRGTMNRKRKGKGKGKGKRKRRNKKPSTVKKPPWLKLPEEIWANILHRLCAIDILLNAQNVCTSWRKICKGPSMWHAIDMSHCRDFYLSGAVSWTGIKTMCFHAIDRSQGELVDIRMDYFVTTEVLNYLVERSGKLKKLRIACCSIARDCLLEVVQKLTLLEELSFTHSSNIRPVDIEALGRSCPQLKSFELNNFYLQSRNVDDQALAIANNMPALQHLQLIGNNMANAGLQAILDGCPHLVSLDVRQCFNLRIDEKLSSRISVQIKHVKLPADSLADFEYYVVVITSGIGGKVVQTTEVKCTDSHY